MKKTQSKEHNWKKACFYCFSCNQKTKSFYFSCFVTNNFQSSPNGIYPLYTAHDLHFTEKPLFCSASSLLPYGTMSNPHSFFFFCPRNDFRFGKEGFRSLKFYFTHIVDLLTFFAVLFVLTPCLAESWSDGMFLQSYMVQLVWNNCIYLFIC